MEITINFSKMFGLTKEEMQRYMQYLIDKSIAEGSFETCLEYQYPEMLEEVSDD